MTFSDRNDDLVTAQEKLEWVTPKISLMEAEETEGSKANQPDELPTLTFLPTQTGPS